MYVQYCIVMMKCHHSLFFVQYVYIIEFTSVGLAEDRGVRVRVDVAGGPGQQRDPGGGVVRARLLLT